MEPKNLKNENKEKILTKVKIDIRSSSYHISENYERINNEDVNLISKKIKEKIIAEKKKNKIHKVYFKCIVVELAKNIQKMEKNMLLILLSGHKVQFIIGKKNIKEIYFIILLNAGKKE